MITLFNKLTEILKDPYQVNEKIKLNLNKNLKKNIFLNQC